MEGTVAEDITIEGQRYRRRHPLGVLGLSFLTLGIYYFYWYYQVNDELRRFEHDESISPVRSLMAVLFGWIIIVPPFIALWNTATHIERAERRVGVTSAIEPVLVLVFQIVFSLVNPPYMQDHMNRIWERAGSTAAMPPGGSPEQLPPPP
jgi:hypothetical protein